jgi:hypothetical protein
VKRRRGFVQVCENDAATWLPFEPFSLLATHRPTGGSAEALYEFENSSISSCGNSFRVGMSEKVFLMNVSRIFAKKQSLTSQREPATIRPLKIQYRVFQFSFLCR